MLDFHELFPFYLGTFSRWRLHGNRVSKTRFTFKKKTKKTTRAASEKKEIKKKKPREEGVRRRKEKKKDQMRDLGRGATAACVAGLDLAWPGS